MSDLGLDWLNSPQLSREDRAVAGCDCGGLHWHVTGCSIFTMDRDAAQQAIADAEAKVQAHLDMLNARLRAIQPAPLDTNRWGPGPDQVTVTYTRKDEGR